MPEQRSVIVCANSSEGHVRPMLAVAAAFARRAWRVHVLTGPTYRDRVEGIGGLHLRLPPEADIQESTRTGPNERASGLRALNDGVRNAFLASAPAAWAVLHAAIDELRPDVVAAEYSFVAAAGIAGLAEPDRPYTVMCGIFPLMLSSIDTAPFGLGIPPVHRPLNRPRNRLLAVLATKVLLAPVHRAMDDTLREIGAAPLNGRFFLDFARSADLIAQFTVEEFEYPRTDSPPALRFYGPTTRGARTGEPLPEWWDRLDPSIPIVHVSQGTVANDDFGELIAPTVAALGNERVQIVVATGGPPISALPPLPPNAFAAAFVPYDALMPRTAVFVSNGGYGGLHSAMEHGVPVVVAGDTEDKSETCAHAAWSGIGINLRSGPPAARDIRRAVTRVLRTREYARASARIGTAIAGSPGADGLVADVERRLR